MLDHHCERFGLVSPFLQPFQPDVSDNVSRVPFDAAFAIGTVKIGVVVASLTAEDFPGIETTGLGLHVPLSEDGGGVATLLELLGPRRAFGIQGSAEIYDAILVTVQSGHHGRS